jgi:hypothetical protein
VQPPVQGLDSGGVLPIEGRQLALLPVLISVLGVFYGVFMGD